ncbi:tail fiber assembly protein [Erwinia pyrifoliae]|uniref:Tail fiber assembly protein n=1 Tax=Erwinia pyrifoliae TaxID=79967 RepID=A0ABY5X3Y7_ERWPY|nr:tail fiber assembly protein [Erwinia pyrifoliae]MCT2388630.1 tail fiber assembly protein [Erwinia pyrifoliae]MCU8586799.1 tail fiber assembly protein [Erwinia pyrifoliae]UWS30676.1 tail fiber assembly protein [Erwinia pyrifoliae]UWS32100.1 tail fiber assembly protein [Erwinia pyrifoliae]UXK13689.1 tail fiber assembly protein [Erwinia pyrifoliae]
MATITLDKNGLAKTSGTLTVYNFDSLTGEFTGATDEYLAQGVGIPDSACTTAPPVAETGSVAIYRDGSWKVQADHRGETVYSTSDGTAQLISAPGDYPAGTTLLAPENGFDKWDGAKWVTDTGAQHAAAVQAADSEKAARIAEANSITQAWQTQLILGIITDADKNSLTAWMKYVQDVQAVNIAAAPFIIWPEKPE